MQVKWRTAVCVSQTAIDRRCSTDCT